MAPTTEFLPGPAAVIAEAETLKPFNNSKTVDVILVLESHVWSILISQINTMPQFN